jgi:hypothetical protein
MRSITHLLLISSCALTAFAREEVKRDFSRTIPMPAGGTFRVENRNGRVSVRTHARAELQIVASIRCNAPSREEAQRFAEAVQIVVDPRTPSVRTVVPDNWHGNISYSIDYDITMPDSAPLDLRNRFGATDVSNLHAPATINSGNGSVTLIDGRGRQRIENTFGNVEVRRNDGDVSVSNGNGRVTVTDVSGAVDIGDRFGDIRVTNAGRGLTVRSNNCGIDVENLGGPTSITNSFGRVVVSDAKSDVIVQNQNGEIVANVIAGTATLNTSFAAIQVTRVGKSLNVHAQNSGVRGDGVNESATVETTFGSVDLRNVKGGARVTTGNSPIRLSGIGGEVYAKGSFAGVTVMDAVGPITVEGQNGAVEVDAKPAGRCLPISLRTSFAPIRVTLPRGVGYNLAAHTSFGRIHTDPSSQVTLSGDISQDSLNGRIGAGGCDLKLTGQNSNIDILSR